MTGSFPEVPKVDEYSDASKFLATLGKFDAITRKEKVFMRNQYNHQYTGTQHVGE